jgi:AraC-like DNA-binding protein
VKPAFEKTPQRQWESLHCEVLLGDGYHSTWHYHTEYQLTLVVRSNGYRLVGDRITPLRSGDLVLVGSHLPHVWHQDEARDGGHQPVHAFIVRFRNSFLGREFLQIPEAAPIRRLLHRARRGLHVTGKTCGIVGAKMKQLPESGGLERVVGLLSILVTLANSEDLEPIASPDFAPVLSSGDQSRVERVLVYIHTHFAEPLNRAAVATEAHLSVAAFSRFFKLRTGKTLPQYVNELRVGRACSLLANERLKVTDLALESGFQNLANFNRHFRKITGLSPSEYRRRLRRNLFYG